MNLILAMILGANIIATAIVFVSESGPRIGEMSLVAVLGFCFSVLLVIILLLRISESKILTDGTDFHKFLKIKITTNTRIIRYDFKNKY
ncbi:hypothetical protein [Chryseobacterium indoltheticum]|uniref:hypothetical protein n=1 Tax=Chryseobacterium indoltheticum TaxID=254 RepID=UPI003F4982B0